MLQRNVDVRLSGQDELLGLSEVSLGVFVKLLLVGARMEVKGVFVNGSVYGGDALRDEIGFSGEEWGRCLAELIERGLLIERRGVYCIANARRYFYQTTYSDNAIADVVAVLKKELPPEHVSEVAVLLESVGQFKKEKSADQLREELLALYARFGDKRGIAQSYVGCFRTKTQIEKQQRIYLPKHLTIVKALLEMYETGKVVFDGKEHDVSKQDLEWAMDAIAKRRLVGLRNHNYLKVMLVNKSRDEFVVSHNRTVRRTHEGF